ncbi:MAG: hypothetical protein KIT34_08185 [Cyanobacteria bacterium TGS_CYA1]|nr:hypothetical protein [Cyanobacteria bacterium TGS_CYA1]
MLEDFSTPITNEKQAFAWWKKFRTLSNIVLIFLMAICIFCFVSVRLNLEMAIADQTKREYFSGPGLLLAIGIPWAWNLIFNLIKERHMKNFQKLKSLQTKKASTALVLSLIGVFILGSLGYFLDFSIYSTNYQKRQKSTNEMHAMPLH